MSLLDKSTQENATLADQTSNSSKSIYSQSKELGWVVKELNTLLDRVETAKFGGHDHRSAEVHELVQPEQNHSDNNFKLVAGGEDFSSSNEDSTDDWDKL